MNIISSSFGNDSCSLVQWCIENDEMADIVYIDTGWASPEWADRVAMLTEHFKSSGFNTIKLKGEMDFAEMCVMKSGFPFQRAQFCTALLKGLPFLNYLDEIDKDLSVITMIGKRRCESRGRADTQPIVESEYHGGRLIAHPLYLHSDEMRDALLKRSGIEILPHRSRECHPCVNANRADLRSLTEEDIEKVASLEAIVGKNMFRAAKHNGAEGIRETIRWANYSVGAYDPDQDDLFDGGCSSEFGCLL